MNIEDLLMKKIDIRRYEHSRRVMDTALKLADRYGINQKSTYLASILHDCGKAPRNRSILKLVEEFDMVLDPIMIHNTELIHGPLGAKIAKKVFEVEDEDVLNAIAYHTTGRENMTKLEKIIYIADFIEPNRNFIGVEDVKNLAFEDIDKTVLLIMDKTIEFLVKEKRLIHIDTIKGRNHLKIFLEI